MIALSLLPPALAGLALQDRSSAASAGRARSPRACAGAARRWRVAEHRAPGTPDDSQDATRGARDGLALGLAQALALAPGVSRNGATLTAARARGFVARTHSTLSWHAALPVILGASALKGVRRARRRGRREDGAVGPRRSRPARPQRVRLDARSARGLLRWPARALGIAARRVRALPLRARRDRSRSPAQDAPERGDAMVG